MLRWRRVVQLQQKQKEMAKRANLLLQCVCPLLSLRRSIQATDADQRCTFMATSRQRERAFQAAQNAPKRAVARTSCKNAQRPRSLSCSVEPAPTNGSALGCFKVLVAFTPEKESLQALLLLS